MLTIKQLPNTDLQVSQFCLGGAEFGAARLHGEDAWRLYSFFREQGGNFIDTAHSYAVWEPETGAGSSERAFGEVIRREGRRKELVIATKGGHPNVPGDYPQPDSYLSPEAILKQIEESLERLGIEQIDLYYLHRDDPRVPVSEIIDMLNGEVAAGRLRCLGASNWPMTRIEQANAYAKQHNFSGFIALESYWNLAQSNEEETEDPTIRFIQADDIRWLIKNQFPLIAYTPTAYGYFATDGKVNAEYVDNEISRQRLRRVQQLAKELGRTPNQIAIAYLTSHPFPVIPIFGSTKIPHLQDALGAADIHLTTAQCDWLLSGSV